MLQTSCRRYSFISSFLFLFVPTITYQSRLALVPPSIFHAQYFLHLLLFCQSNLLLQTPHKSRTKIEVQEILYKKKPTHPIEIETVHTLCVHQTLNQKLEEQRERVLLYYITSLWPTVIGQKTTFHPITFQVLVVKRT